MMSARSGERMSVKKAHQSLPVPLLIDPPPAHPRPGQIVEYPEVEYPESDGEPMADNAFQEHVMHNVTVALRLYFDGRDDVLIANNLIVYYVEGDPSTSIVPDVFVTLGVSREARPWYKVWTEGRPPDFVLEVTSPRTADQDRYVKPGVYESMGVREYFQFNPQPQEALLKPRLQGRRLRDGAYEELQATSLRGVEASIRSEVLGLEFHANGRRLQVWDDAEKRYLSAVGEQQGRKAERERRKAEEARRKAEEARRKAEEARRMDEEARRMDEEARRKIAEERIRILEERAQADALEKQHLRERIAQFEAGSRGHQHGDQ